MLAVCIKDFIVLDGHGCFHWKGRVVNCNSTYGDDFVECIQLSWYCGSILHSTLVDDQFFEKHFITISVQHLDLSKNNLVVCIKDVESYRKGIVYKGAQRLCCKTYHTDIVCKSNGDYRFRYGNFDEYFVAIKPQKQIEEEEPMKEMLDQSDPCLSTGPYTINQLRAARGMKPLLGVKPRKFHIEERIQELGRAIHDYVDQLPNTDPATIRKWVEELEDLLVEYEELYDPKKPTPPSGRCGNF